MPLLMATNQAHAAGYRLHTLPDEVDPLRLRIAREDRPTV